LPKGSAGSATPNSITSATSPFGSLYETRSHLLVARDLEYTPHDAWHEMETQALVVTRLLNAFMRTLRPD